MQDMALSGASDAARSVSPARSSLVTNGILYRLLKSRSGNVLPIVAAGLIPMAAMVGGAVDMSRAYMVKARIQQACDAGVLAGRRAMQHGSYTQAARNQANDFFNINFNDGFQGTTDLDFTTTNPSGTSRVSGAATVNVPTVIMGMFGKTNIPVEVECEAELNVSNSDVTFVLDTTGSMSGSISNGSGGTTTRIQSLRNAVLSFYDTLAGAGIDSNTRIRYGFVPYSVTTNVGELLYDNNPNLLVGGTAGDAWSYQSRRPIWNVSTFSTTEQTYQVSISRSKCQKYGDNEDFNQGGGNNFRPSPEGTPVTENGETVTYERHSWGGVLASDGWSGSGNRTCVRRRNVVTTTESPEYAPGATFARWEYLQRTYEVNDYVRSIKSFNPAVVLPTETGTVYDRWEGCVEERDTVSANDFSYVAGQGIVPSGGGNAYDLDFDTTPFDQATKWRPYWKDVYYRRDGNSNTMCPQKARLLSTMTRTDVQNYVNSLSTGGNTYHDIGLIWGGRISSPDGIFRDNVILPPSNQGVVSRHLIYMTDGELVTSSGLFTSWGIESLDQRVTNGSNNPSLQERHRRRFLAVCEAVKGKGIRLWVVAFGTSLGTDLVTCASSGSAFSAQNSTELQNSFTQIAQKISELRLTQ
jgi:Flp pilus assembly protein TadG